MIGILDWIQNLFSPTHTLSLSRLDLATSNSEEVKSKKRVFYPSGQRVIAT